LRTCLAEDRCPPDSLWARPLVSSRLLEYELWTRIHVRDLTRTHGDHVRQLLGRVAVLELIGEVLGRARDPFPTPVRTLDALHLASADFLREQGVEGRPGHLRRPDAGGGPRPRPARA